MSPGVRWGRRPYRPADVRACAGHDLLYRQRATLYGLEGLCMLQLVLQSTCIALGFKGPPQRPSPVAASATAPALHPRHAAGTPFQEAKRAAVVPLLYVQQGLMLAGTSRAPLCTRSLARLASRVGAQCWPSLRTAATPSPPGRTTPATAASTGCPTRTTPPLPWSARCGACLPCSGTPPHLPVRAADVLRARRT